MSSAQSSENPSIQAIDRQEHATNKPAISPIYTGGTPEIREWSHEAEIVALIKQRPSCARHKFWSLARPALGPIEDDGNPHFIPDAFEINANEKRITIYEVVDTHDISDEKYGLISDYAFRLDDRGWALILVRVDRFGAIAWNVMNTVVRAMVDNRFKNGFPSGWRDCERTDPSNPEHNIDLRDILTGAM